jgi:hypothetical protein
MLRHPLGVVSALLTEAHAEGQLGNESAALLTVRHARAILDDVSPKRRKVKRAECAGVAGQYSSRVHNFRAAERNLLRAVELARDVDDSRQVCLWTVRRAENLLRQGALPETERVLSEAHELYARYGIGGMERAKLWRVSATFALATGRLDEADRWTARAREFASSHRLDHQLLRLQTLVPRAE